MNQLPMFEAEADGNTQKLSGKYGKYLQMFGLVFFKIDPLSLTKETLANNRPLQLTFIHI